MWPGVSAHICTMSRYFVPIHARKTHSYAPQNVHRDATPNRGASERGRQLCLLASTAYVYEILALFAFVPAYLALQSVVKSFSAFHRSSPENG